MAAPDRREERRRPWPPAAADADAAAGGSTIPGSEEEGSSRLRLQDRLTVIVTTSNPDTTIIRRVLSSFGIVPGLDACRKIIVCDGFQVAGPGAAPKYKKGKIASEEVAAYEAYIQSLRDLAAESAAPGFACTEVHALPDRHGFGGAVHVGCSLTKTPYVLVVQHDRPFIAGVDLAPALTAMDGHPEVRYIGLRSSRTRHFSSEAAVIAKGPVRLRRLWFWYDSTHLCRTSLYQGLFHWRLEHFLLPQRAALGDGTGVVGSSSPPSRLEGEEVGEGEGGSVSGSTSSSDGDGDDDEEEEGLEAPEGEGSPSSDSKGPEGSKPPPPVPLRWAREKKGVAAAAVGDGVAEAVMGKMTFGSRFPQWAKVKRLRAPILKKGFFIEDTFGQLMLTHLQTVQRQQGLAAADAVHEERYGAYLLVAPLLQTRPNNGPYSSSLQSQRKAVVEEKGAGCALSSSQQQQQQTVVEEEGEEEEEVVAHLDGRRATVAQLRANGLEPGMRKGERHLRRRSERQEAEAEAEARGQAEEQGQRRREQDRKGPWSLLGDEEGEGGMFGCLGLLGLDGEGEAEGEGN